MKEKEGEEAEEGGLCAVTHSARSGEVGALHNALPHLTAEQANKHTLQVLRGDLQKHHRSPEFSDTVCVCLCRTEEQGSLFVS